MRHIPALLLASQILLSPLQAIAQDASAEEEADRAQLRQLLEAVQRSINEGRYEDIAQYFHKDFTATMITQEVLTTREQIEQYFNKWLKGENAFIRKLTVSPVVEGETRIYDGKFAVAHGSDRETYELASGHSYDLEMKWTASLVKSDGQWKITSFHAGVNFLDNPVLKAAEKSATYLALAGLCAGLLAGVGVMYFRNRMKRKKLRDSKV